jgi:surfactin synthase thioesterase subunit
VHVVDATHPGTVVAKETALAVPGEAEVVETVRLGARDDPHEPEYQLEQHTSDSEVVDWVLDLDLDRRPGSRFAFAATVELEAN